MISFSLALLKKQSIDIEGEEPPSFLEVKDSDMISFKYGVHYHLHASMVSNGVLVKGSVYTYYDGICGRCLKKFKGKFGRDDICMFFNELHGAELDVSEEIRAELVVEIPINCICSPSCKGLCHHCGADLNKEKCSCEDNDDENSPWGELDKLDL